MNWKEVLKIKIEALGSKPSKEQKENLEAWILKNVPESNWSAVSIYLPGELQTEFSMRSAECGYF